MILEPKMWKCPLMRPSPANCECNAGPKWVWSLTYFPWEFIFWAAAARIPSNRHLQSLHCRLNSCPDGESNLEYSKNRNWVSFKVELFCSLFCLFGETEKRMNDMRSPLNAKSNSNQWTSRGPVDLNVATHIDASSTILFHETQIL